MDTDLKALQNIIAAEVARREYERVTEVEGAAGGPAAGTPNLPNDLVRAYELLELESYLPSAPWAEPTVAPAAQAAGADAQQRARGLYTRLTGTPLRRVLNHPRVTGLLRRAQQRPGGATLGNLLRVVISGIVRRVPGAHRLLHLLVVLRYLPERLRDLEYHAADGNTRLRNLGLQIQDQANQSLYSQGLAIQENQAYLLERIKRLEQQVRQHRTSQPTVAAEPVIAADMPAEMYVAFEDRFRGSSEQIRERLQANVPLLQAVVLGQDRPVLDLGCGRGEWLRLLVDNNVQALGIDTNPSMVEHCRSSGLQAEVADALVYLRQQPEKSLPAVTAFHVIEHVPLSVLVELIDEALRVIRPGGLVLFETPNPENLIVGACNFYTDPTHRNPLPPALMAFMLESRGFVNVRIDRRHPADPALLLQGEDQALTQTLNRLLFGAQDYAVIGYAP